MAHWCVGVISSGTCCLRPRYLLVDYLIILYYHLVDHGFVKALLFVSAGSIIHALTDEQDLGKKGGLIKYHLIHILCMAHWCVGVK